MATAVVITELRLRPQRLHFGGYKFIGFRGAFQIAVAAVDIGQRFQILHIVIVLFCQIVFNKFTHGYPPLICYTKLNSPPQALILPGRIFYRRLNRSSPNT